MIGRLARAGQIMARSALPAAWSSVLSAFLISAGPATAYTIEYADLVETTRIVRTGQRLHEILPALGASRSLRGAAQPILDPHTVLLNEAIDLIEPPRAGDAPFIPLASWYPEGEAEPAWVALVRGGRIAAFTDGAGRLRLFVPGRDPESAWRRWYPVLRHILTALVPDSGPLETRLWSYTHNYAQSRITISREPRVVRGRSWAAPANSRPLDGPSLEAFFAAGLPLGGGLRTGTGLQLLSGSGEPPSLDGRPVELSDLAVAWRAVAWAGDNDAFISLDPHADPTRASVNFGGYLENTRIGATVLSADKRFKTITSGLDPDSLRDIRKATTVHVPGFLTTPERDLLTQHPRGNGWIGTRFWFYPESVELATDPDYTEVEIVRARFTADAERQRGDFTDERTFTRDRRRLLSPSIRAAIDDLNARYELYARAFSEFRELETVARLLGICSWLKRGGGRGLDLDALLGMMLPAAPTPKDRAQMITANWIATPAGFPWPDTAEIREGLWSIDLAPLLDSTVEEFFGTPEAYQEFLGSPPGAGRSEPNWATKRLLPVRSLIATPDSLQRWALRAARKIQPTALAQSRMALLDGSIITRQVVSIAGGINLGPDEFRIRVRPARRSARAGGTDAGRGERATRTTASSIPRTSSPRGTDPAQTSRTPSPPATSPPATSVTFPAEPAPVPAAPPLVTQPVGRITVQPPTEATTLARAWSDQVRTPNGAIRSRQFDPRHQILVVREARGSEADLVAARRFGDRIVFRRIRGSAQPATGMEISSSRNEARARAAAADRTSR